MASIEFYAADVMLTRTPRGAIEISVVTDGVPPLRPGETATVRAGFDLDELAARAPGEWGDEPVRVPCAASVEIRRRWWLYRRWSAGLARLAGRREPGLHIHSAEVRTYDPRA